jgi:hypothetical protein
MVPRVAPESATGKVTVSSSTRVTDAPVTANGAMPVVVMVFPVVNPWALNLAVAVVPERVTGISVA